MACFLAPLFKTLGITWCETTQTVNGIPLSEWTILNGVPVYKDYVNKPYFDFPNVPKGVNYLTKKVSGITKNFLRMDYTITATGNPVFDYRTADNNMVGNPVETPGKIRLFIQRKGDNLSAVGEYQQYRYWSTKGFSPLAVGSNAVYATLDPNAWTDVYGKTGAMNPLLWNKCLAEAENVGVTFGGGSFYGHGVFVTGGTARFTIDGFTS